MMARPHFNRSLADLEQIFVANGDDVGTLKEIEDELGHRTRPAARRLLAAVQKKIRDGQATVEDTRNQAPREKRPNQDSQTEGASVVSPVTRSDAGRKLNGELFGNETEALSEL